MPAPRSARAAAEPPASPTPEIERPGVNGRGLPDGLQVETLLEVLRDVRRGNYSARIPPHGSATGRKLIAELNALIEAAQRSQQDLARSAESAARVARVLEAVAGGDLSRTMDLEGGARPLQAPFLRTARTVNSMVRQLRTFTSEVTRVAEEVGTHGKLGGQARVRGAAGVWKELTDNVNSMAQNLTSQVRNIADVTTAVARGDLSRKITVDVHGEILELKNTINGMVDQLNAFAGEVTRVAREVGIEGRLGGQAYVAGASGTWKELTDNVNQLAANLTTQVRNIADVTTAVARGDLSKKITVDVRGEILELKETINTMVDQLNAFASEVTRVAREVGTEGKLGGQAEVKGVAGVWKDLTDNVNLMAGNLTDQVRGIARVVTAVAHGDLNKKLVFEAKGEIAALADTINEMTGTLARFAEQVTSVAREVGSEGKLGGQAIVPGAAGTWADLTDNVNRLAANLTIQVRAIADVATAVTEGDLTRSIGVETQGEVALLKDKINEMIRRLRVTTDKNTEQDWLKTNLAKHTRMLQGHRDLTAAAQRILSEVVPLVDAQHGTLYTSETAGGGQPILRLRAAYAHGADDLPTEFRLGEGLVGQCALGQRPIVMNDLPTGAVSIRTGLGEITPVEMVLMPILFEGEVKAVIELASVRHFSRIHLDFLHQLAESIGILFNAIEANMRTEERLKQSQTLFAEAQEASRSKSAFLSMAAHELRTPLSVITGYLSMLQDGTLTVETAQRPIEMLIAKGKELNRIVNDLLMAARVEGGTVPTQIVRVDLRTAVQEALARAEPRTTLLGASVAYTAPAKLVPVNVDLEQLGRILDNLLNNALTYTRGRPEITVWLSNEDTPRLFIEDLGVGVPADGRERIFERFYRIDHPELGAQPGTGLGLFISRELAHRMGGTLILDWSEIGKGTRFVLTLPPALAMDGAPSVPHVLAAS